MIPAEDWWNNLAACAESIFPLQFVTQASVMPVVSRQALSSGRPREAAVGGGAR